MNETHTFLLVDDSDNDRFLTRIAFGKAGAPVLLQELSDGEEAIAYLNGDGVYCDRRAYPLPTVMLLDLKMPKRNGFDVLSWVRSKKAIKRLVIVVVTASVRSEDVNMSFDLGANAFVVKPSTMDELIAMIHSLGEWLKYNRLAPLTDDAE